MIYLDYNATTPVDKQVVDHMLPFFTRYFGNPSSSHGFGAGAAPAIAKARATVAGCLGAENARVVFTSGGTEANNLALKGSALPESQYKKHIITSSVEHPSIQAPLQFLQRQGFDITYIKVDESGRVDPHDIERAIRNDTLLISVMLANNETGTIQPIAEIGSIANQHKVLMHTDAAQAIGKMPVNFEDLNVDMMSIAGHKFYAPKGVGALIVRPGLNLEPLLHGAGHETGVRAGTENTPYLIGLSHALANAVDGLPEYGVKVRVLRDKLEQGIQELYPPATVNGGTDRLCNTLNISFPGLDYKNLLDGITPHIACSTGSACHSGDFTGSPVLKAMGLEPAVASSALRFSLGRDTEASDIDGCLTAIKHVLSTI